MLLVVVIEVIRKIINQMDKCSYYFLGQECSGIYFLLMCDRVRASACLCVSALL